MYADKTSTEVDYFMLQCLLLQRNSGIKDRIEQATVNMDREQQVLRNTCAYLRTLMRMDLCLETFMESCRILDTQVHG